MKKGSVVSVKAIFQFSFVGILALLGALFAFSKLSDVNALNIVWLAYIAASLVFATSGFILLLRHWRVTPEHGFAIRGLAMLGAVVVFCVAGILTYPIFALLPKL